MPGVLSNKANAVFKSVDLSIASFSFFLGVCSLLERFAMQFGFRLENQASLIIERQVHKFKGVWECLNNVKHCEIDDFIFF